MRKEMKILAKYSIRYNEAEGWAERVEVLPYNKTKRLAYRFGKPTPEALRYLFGKLAEAAQEKAREV